MLSQRWASHPFLTLKNVSSFDLAAISLLHFSANICTAVGRRREKQHGRTDGPPVGEREKGPKGGSIYSPETPYSFTITKQMYCRYSTVRAPLEKQTERKRLEMDDGLVLASRQGLSSSSSVGPTVRPGGQNKSRRRRMLQAKRRTTMSLRQNDGRSVVWRQGRKSLLSLPAFLEVDKFLVRQL